MVAPATRPVFPDSGDLLEEVHFAPEEGRIWLGEQRMILLHGSALGVLRRELIEGLGIEKARGLLTRIGYNSGAHDAELTRTLRTDLDRVAALVLGAQLHMIEGVARVEPVAAEVDTETGHFYGEFLWHGSAEDEVHVRDYGIGVEPACWMQVGYASGFASSFMGRPVVFREIECASQGAGHCRIVGKPAEHWVDAEDDLRPFQVDELTSGVSTGRIVSPSGFEGYDVVGVSAGFNAVCHMLRRVADTQATVLLLGESGVGKEVLARALHRISPREGGPFIALNCAAIPDTLIEAELFGVEKGAFTGAAARHGRFELANGGTLFLDEIGNLNWSAQGKLLRALQEREIERVGSGVTHKVDVRVVAATNLDLRAAIKAGRFREDLFYRLNVFPVRVPPLRERREDIPVFMHHFLGKYNARNKRAARGFSARATEAFLSYDWPGNVRELENLVERGVILAPADGVIDTAHLFLEGEEITNRLLSIGRDGLLQPHVLGKPVTVEQNDPETRLVNRIGTLLGGEKTDLSLPEIEALLIEQAVASAGGNLSAAARLLGISRPKLEYRLKNRRQAT